MIGMVGVVYLGITTLILHLQPTGYDPIRQVVSDYAVGHFGTEMALGFFAGGVGVAALAIAILLTSIHRTLKIGSIPLFVTGVALFIVGAFPTDLEGAPITVHGTIHSILSLFVFTLGPLGMVVISYGYNRKWFLATLLGFVVTSVFAVSVQLGFGAMGLAERGLIAVLLTWWFAMSLHVFRISMG
jgi:hypothetical membrane protein